MEALVRDIADQAAALLEEQICKECYGPVETLYDADGNKKGLYPLRQPKALSKTLKTLAKFRPKLTDEYAKSEIGRSMRKHYGSKKRSPDDAPFFTEHFLYGTIGKEDARTVLAIVRNVARASGLSELWLLRNL